MGATLIRRSYEWETPDYTHRARKRKEDAASVLETHSSHLFPCNLDPTKIQFSRRTISGGEEETCVIHDSITDLWIVSKTSLIVT